MGQDFLHSVHRKTGGSKWIKRRVEGVGSFQTGKPRNPEASRVCDAQSKLLVFPLSHPSIGCRVLGLGSKS